MTKANPSSNPSRDTRNPAAADQSGLGEGGVPMLKLARPARSAKAARRKAPAPSADNDSSQGSIPKPSRADDTPRQGYAMKVLLIENNPADAELVSEMLRQVPLNPLELVHEHKLSKALARLRAEHYDVILLDLPLPEGRRFNDVERICSAAVKSAVVVLSRHDEAEIAVEVLRRGAHDYLHKGSLNTPQISRVIRYAVERKRVNEEQIELMARYRSLTQAASDAIISIDMRGHIIFWNDSAEKIFGYQETEVMDKPLRMLIPERYHVLFVAELNRSQTLQVLPHSVRNIQLQVCRKSGGEFPIELSISAWWHAKQMGFTGIVRDVTERKMLESSLVNSREELSNLSRRLLAIQEQERNRISIKVHDQLGQSLTALKLDLAWTEQRLIPQKQAKLIAKMGEMTLLVNQTLAEVREIASDLRPGLLDHFGLPAAVEWLFKEFSERTGIQCRLIVTPVELEIDRDSALLLFRVVQEAMTNVARHAKASKLKIELSRNNGNLKMDIQDNGKGISPSTTSNLKSLGLLGMRERIKGAGGVMKIGGGPGRGTLLSVEIPHHVIFAVREGDGITIIREGVNHHDQSTALGQNL